MHQLGQPTDALAVGNDVFVSAHLDGQTAVTVGRPLVRDVFQCRLQRFIISWVRLVIVTAAWNAQHPADQLYGILSRQLLNHSSPLFRAAPKLCETFFATSSSSVNRPARRSSSAMRACSWLRCSSLRKTRWAFSRQLGFPTRQDFGFEAVFPTRLATILNTHQHFKCHLGFELRCGTCGVFSLVRSFIGPLELIIPSVQLLGRTTD